MKLKYEKENFTLVVKNSKTIKEVCLKLDMKKTGGGS